MFRNIKISAKITGLVLILAIITVVVISYLTYDINREAAIDNLNTNLSVVADNRASLLNTHLEKAASSIKLLQNSETTKNLLSGTASEAPAGGMDLMALMGDDTAASDSIVESDPLTSYLTTVKEIYSFDQVLITDSKGLITASTDKKLKKGI